MKYIKTTFKQGFIAITLYCFVIPVSSYSQITLETQNNINAHILESSITEVGVDLENTFETGSDETILSVKILPESLNNMLYRSWDINISKNDIDWHNDLKIYVKKTGNGESEFNTTTLGGGVYQKIENYDQYFFEGTGWIENIPLQYKITGISVTVPAKTYTTEIIITLSDN